MILQLCRRMYQIWYRRVRKGEQGSIAPLGLVLFIFSLSFSFTVVSATSLFIFQKRLTNLAESVAVFVASGGGDSEDFLLLTENFKFEQLQVNDELAPDEVTVDVVACAQWSAPIVLADVVGKSQVCSHASARAGN